MLFAQRSALTGAFVLLALSACAQQGEFPSLAPRPVEKAMAELEFSRKRAAGDVLKLLKSAVANADNNHGLDIDSLVVAEAHVGKNLVMKRMHARARGRGVRVNKPFSQLTIVLRDTSQAAQTSEAA